MRNIGSRNLGRSSSIEGRWSTSDMEDLRCICCRRRRVIQTSWTDANPGRRFLNCPTNGCNQFTWVDPPMCSRAMQIILGLLKKVNEHHSLCLSLKKQFVFILTKAGHYHSIKKKKKTKQKNKSGILCYFNYLSSIHQNN
ncbi:hypothetical protein HYC85_019819 [Camellia sinensis]|uniref:GRF-type domain-containing protein n=1 Tax=Camellia sinensis TaxID=4442 RepID=A0A7J7GNY0_CAMSI|nr:hypothetical protein HYC85_019819 [Camellia sinensis]